MKVGALKDAQISGPSSVPSGGVRGYSCLGLFGDDSSIDVTSHVSWSVRDVNPPASGFFDGNNLHCGTLAVAEDIVVRAAVTWGNQTLVREKHLTIEPIFGVRIVPHVIFGSGILGDRWDVQLEVAWLGGNGPPVAYAWDLDGDGLRDDSTSANPTKTYSGNPRTVLVQVEAEDPSGAKATAAIYVPLERCAAGEPPTKASADVLRGSFYSAANEEFIINAERGTHGLVLVTHGLCENARLPWLETMARAMERRLQLAGTPNIALYDWEEMADPGRFDGEGDECQVGINYEFLRNIATIRPYAIAHGRILADWIGSQERLGNIDASKPIHLIGFSAGGFVAGECAKALKEADPASPGLVHATMLDTPHPVREHFTVVPNPGKVERYVSSLAGEFAPLVDGIGCDPQKRSLYAACFDLTGFLANTLSCWLQVPTGLFYHKRTLQAPAGLVEGHHYAHDWYIRTIESSEVDGFWFSPWFGNEFPAEKGFAGSGGNSPFGARQQPLADFQTFGAVTSSDGVYFINEAGNAGVFKTLSLPPGVQNVQFRYTFASGGDGDFLAVHWGSNEVLYLGLDLHHARSDFVTAEASLYEFAGETGNLVFKLVSRGDSNAVVVLDQIALSIRDDADGDGLMDGEEQVLGTDPLRIDSDGDGLCDAEELLTYGTNPLAMDGDGDSAPDGDEIAVGTDPRNAASVFKVVAIRKNSEGMITLEWTGGPGNVYRVKRAACLAARDFLTLTNHLLAAEPITSSLIRARPATAVSTGLKCRSNIARRQPQQDFQTILALVRSASTRLELGQSLTLAGFVVTPNPCKSHYRICLWPNSSVRSRSNRRSRLWKLSWPQCLPGWKPGWAGPEGQSVAGPPPDGGCSCARAGRIQAQTQAQGQRSVEKASFRNGHCTVEKGQGGWKVTAVAVKPA